MTFEETADYIRWRLNVAGAAGEGPFTSEAIRVVHRVSGGIPRIVNNLCDNALLSGYSQEASHVTPEIIREVADVLGFQELPETFAGSDGEEPRLREREAEDSTIGLSSTDLEALLELGTLSAGYAAVPAVTGGPRWTGSAPSEWTPDNVSYIHKDFEEWKVPLPAAWDTVRFTIEIGSEAGNSSDLSPVRYFSRVRVSKCS